MHAHECMHWWCTYLQYLNIPTMHQPVKTYEMLTWVLVLGEIRLYRYWHILAHTCTFTHIPAIHAIHTIHAYTCTYLQIHAHTCHTPTLGISFLVHQKHQNTKNIPSFSAHAQASCTMRLGGRVGQVWACLDDPGRCYAMLVARQSKTEPCVRRSCWKLHEPKNKCLFSAPAGNSGIMNLGGPLAMFCPVWKILADPGWVYSCGKTGLCTDLRKKIGWGGGCVPYVRTWATEI